jgi:hypothetical protein
LNQRSFNKYIRVLVLSICIIQGHFCFSQNSKLGNWLIYIGNKKINPTWNLHHEVQYRNYNAISDLEQLLIRTGIGYNFNDNNSNFLLGYGYILSKNYVPQAEFKTSINEHRVFQQFNSKQSIGKVLVNHRYRFEQRFIENNFKLRFRYFLGINLILKQIEKNSLYLSVYNEVFLNSESPIFDRNRLYGGLGLKVNQKLKFELGYMNQLFESNNRDQINIISFLNF